MLFGPLCLTLMDFAMSLRVGDNGEMSPTSFHFTRECYFELVRSSQALLDQESLCVSRRYGCTYVPEESLAE